MTTENDGSAASSKRLFEDLGKLKTESGPNKHDQAITLISACILNGVDTWPGIVGVLTKLDFKWEHVSRILRQENGNPPLGRWKLGLDRRYTLHDEPA
jgi:hypothetical protein